MTEIDDKIDECRTMMAPPAGDIKTMDLTSVFDKLDAWFKSLNVGALPKAALHALVHFALDELCPWLEARGGKLEVLSSMILRSLLLELDTRFHD